MMKKVIAAALLTATVASQSNAAVFNGFAAGLNTGVLFSKNKANKNLRDYLDNEITRANDTHALFGLQFDYEMSKPNSLYSRASLLFSLPTGDSKSSYKNGGYKLSLKAKENFSTELHGAVGYNFCNDVAVYALAGLVLTKKSYSIKQSFNNVSEALSSKSKTKLLPVIGAGVMKKITNNVSAGIEYKHTFESSTSLKEKDSNMPIGKIKSSSDAVLARVSYHF